MCTKQRYGITAEDFQVLCAYSSIHKCELLLSVYPYARPGTSVEQLILITYLWEDAFDQRGSFQEGGELNNLCGDDVHAREKGCGEVTGRCRGAIHCALAACIVFPGGRNELRPYIHYDISYNN